MGHTEAENFLMHLGHFFLNISTQAPPPDTPEMVAAWRNGISYVQEAVLGCFASYQEDMKLRQDQAQQKGNKTWLQT
jgi:hypothetical protein